LVTGFRNRDTERHYGGTRVPRFEGFSRKQANRQFTYLNDAASLSDLASIPGSRFKALTNRSGVYSIRINRQRRIEFEWDDSPTSVAITKHYE